MLKKWTYIVADNMDRKDVCNALKTVNVLRKL